MQIKISGSENSLKKTHQYDLLDYYDEPTHTSSMARTTGYTCTAAVELVLQGLYKRTGISPAELIGEDEPCFHFVMNYLGARKVNYRKTEILT